MNYILYKGEIHQVGSITAAKEIKRNTTEYKGAKKKEETAVPQHTGITIYRLNNSLTFTSSFSNGRGEVGESVAGEGEEWTSGFRSRC